jgi:hypothetical protein
LSASIVEENGQKYLVVTVTRSAPAPGDTMEVSSDLLTWTPAEMVTLTVTPTQVVLRENAPIQDATARFVRLRVATP